MGNLVDHAKNEFLALGYKPIDEEEEGPNKWLQECLIELLHVFSKQGHSGSVAPHFIDMFKKLALFEPLGPLTGEDDEWEAVGEGVFQNRRCSHVFKQKDRFNGQAYDTRGRIFRGQDGCCYISRDSCVPVVFPYTPTTEYIDVGLYHKDCD